MTGTQGGPLAGIRVLDMGWSWAGPFCGMILTDLGAEVIKLESIHRIDILRFSGAFADGVRHHERSGYHGATNRGKRSAALNLKHPESREIVLELADRCDVLIENFAPRVMASLGLGHEVILARNPRLVMLSMSGYGATGPDHEYLSYGDHLLHASGLAAATGAEGDPHTKIGIYYGDPVGGMYGALAIMAALAERDRTGVGRWLELSQLEGLISMIPALVARTSVGDPLPRSADKQPDLCPHGFFRCQGADTWVAIAVRTDAQWAALHALLVASGHEPAVPGDAGGAARKSRESEIDAALTAWTVARSPWQVTLACQEHGIAAYPVQSAPRLLWDAHLKARGFFPWVDRPLTGAGPIPGVSFRVAGDGARVRGYAPFLGEHNEEVYRGLLGYDEARFHDLIARDVIA